MSLCEVYNANDYLRVFFRPCVFVYLLGADLLLLATLRNELPWNPLLKGTVLSSLLDVTRRVFPTVLRPVLLLQMRKQAWSFTLLKAAQLVSGGGRTGAWT